MFLFLNNETIWFLSYRTEKNGVDDYDYQKHKQHTFATLSFKNILHIADIIHKS